jgi:hypothetical protein
MPQRGLQKPHPSVYECDTEEELNELFNYDGVITPDTKPSATVKCGGKPPRQANTTEPEPDSQTSLRFRNFGEALAASKRLFPAPIGDKGIPNEPYYMADMVEQFKDAIYRGVGANADDNDYSEDKPKQKRYHNRFQPGAWHYTDSEIELACWRLAYFVCHDHRNGWYFPGDFAMQVYDKTTIENIMKTATWTIKERVAWILALVEVSDPPVLRKHH